jgi:hypothetical protein
MLVEKHVVKVGEHGSEVHLYSVGHTIKEKPSKRKFVGLEKTLKQVKNVHALAVDVSMSKDLRNNVKKRIKEGGKFYFQKTHVFRPIAEKCLKEKASMIFIGEATTSEDPGKILDSAFIDHNKMLEYAKKQKIPEKFNHLLEVDGFRDVVMTSNVLAALKKHERRQRGPVKMAVVAHPEHVKWIKRYLEKPGEFKQTRQILLKMIGNKYGVEEWVGPATIKPESMTLE